MHTDAGPLREDFTSAYRLKKQAIRTAKRTIDDKVLEEFIETQTLYRKILGLQVPLTHAEHLRNKMEKEKKKEMFRKLHRGFRI